MEVSKYMKKFGKLNETLKKPDNCQIHGSFESISMFQDRWTLCQKCVDDETTKKEAEEQVIKDMEYKAQELKRRIGHSNIPERFLSRSFENYIVTNERSEKALKTALNYADEFRKKYTDGSCLIFSGDVGNGKTHLAAAIANKIIKKGAQPLFISVSKAVRSVKETYSRGSDISERQALDTFVIPELLILDEVGVQFGTDFEKNILFEIINTRYEKMLPTLLISNLSLDAMKNYIGERSFDRMRENGGKVVIFDWESYRTKG